VKRSNLCMLSSIRIYNSSWPDANQQIGKFCGNITDEARTFVSKKSSAVLAYVAYRSYIRVKPFSVAISFTYGNLKNFKMYLASRDIFFS